jgi:hypothetical protein
LGRPGASRTRTGGIPGPTRTGDLLFRKQPRFPAAPRGHAPLEAAVAALTCREACVPGEGLEPPVAGRPTALQDAALPIARPWRGVTDAARTRSLRDHSPALYLVELQPPYSAKESNLFVSRV